MCECYSILNISFSLSLASFSSMWCFLLTHWALYVSVTVFAASYCCSCFDVFLLFICWLFPAHAHTFPMHAYVTLILSFDCLCGANVKPKHYVLLNEHTYTNYYVHSRALLENKKLLKKHVKCNTSFNRVYLNSRLSDSGFNDVQNRNYTQHHLIDTVTSPPSEVIVFWLI